MFTKIDLYNWERRECFEHFINVAKSTISITVNLDITKLKNYIDSNNLRFYPVFTWLVSKAINSYVNFKMGYNEQNVLGYYDFVSPNYSVINDKTKIMDTLTTPYNKNFLEFYNAMTADTDNYKASGARTRHYENEFIVSTLPWINYSSFSVSNESGYQFLFPMVTWGKFITHSGTTQMPLTLQIHHAVADGYHCSLFFNDIQNMANNPEKFLQL